MPKKRRHRSVFINCPFDSAYKPFFDAIVFSITALGFAPRCALEIDDSSQVRLGKIRRIIKDCKYGIHDISAVGLHPDTQLPRFNMPLELGLFVGCKFYGGRIHRDKACLILDQEKYRYQKFISDIAGQDIHAHHGEVGLAVKEVRDWLVSASRTKSVPGGADVFARYNRFVDALPGICARMKLEQWQLTFFDYMEVVELWLKAGG